MSHPQNDKLIDDAIDRMTKEQLDKSWSHEKIPFTGIKKEVSEREYESKKIMFKREVLGCVRLKRWLKKKN